MAAGEILLRGVDLDLDEFAGQRTVDEHDASIGVAGHGIAARDETIRGELHPASVRRWPGRRPMRDTGRRER